MRGCFFFFILVTVFQTQAQRAPLDQNRPLDRYVYDTLRIGEFNAEKVVAYKYFSVTFFVKYEDYIAKLRGYWNASKKSRKYVRRARQKGEYLNEQAVSADARTDSLYRSLKRAIKKADTIYLTESFDGSYYRIGPMHNFFPDLIDKGKCAIIDQHNVSHYVIFRQTGSWFDGPLAAWAGRRYFLAGEKEFFIEATDRIS